ncbi:ABC-type lipoprotein export system, ATPase component [Paenibacillus sophorae]|uniref:ABC-type lipoprotein export system, ATPase component n=1 Tax=Paenibacillus sophorae TaxID=1333845 RepID=A0A1H8JNG3_9BACL|nr:ATP-binding cassette domain-containing protein [Paenibacillus sophorae]QWU13428.1 ATP-binding cassette domain-containing protein [Paenibacillus sophorae]SEN82232.1 ABC-type lipoprotein export system, ATPase component [Paenibacillus sophorae]
MMEDIQSITILGGHSKSGEAEDVALRLVPGDLVAVVGPTGSGKSRLLADIEYIAQRDTPSGRCILINDQPPAPEIRFDMGRKLIAQLSQNMNFVMDATVAEFIAMHAECRDTNLGETGLEELINSVVTQANRLTGEPIVPDTPLTALSGGQSRSLMIADTAILSDSPIVLIDEIENAGIDRRQALDILVQNQKIVLMATHDPILALLAHSRIVLKSGGIADVLESDQDETALLEELQKADAAILAVREKLRKGERLSGSAFRYAEFLAADSI